MNWSVRLLQFGVLVFLLPIFVNGQAKASDHARAINDAYSSWVQVTNEKNLERWSSYLAPQATFLPPNNPKLLNKAEIEEFYSKLFEDPHFHLDCEQTNVVIAKAEDMAWSTGHCEATFTGPDEKVAHDRSKWAKVWLRQPNGEWKCTMNSWSSTGGR